MSISYEEGGRTIKAMGNERSYILNRGFLNRQYSVPVIPSVLSVYGRPVCLAWPAKIFLFGNSHVWLCDLIYPIYPTC